MNINVIEASGLGKRYGRTWALRECTLAVPAGHVTALIGPNGAGKTTLLNLAAGLASPPAGTVSVLGGLAAGVAGRAGRHRVRRPGHCSSPPPSGWSAAAPPNPPPSTAPGTAATTTLLPRGDTTPRQPGSVSLRRGGHAAAATSSAPSVTWSRRVSSGGRWPRIFRTGAPSGHWAVILTMSRRLTRGSPSRPQAI
jgi:energy-coupling factor transporter ATP-binding protein EcfA2